MEGSAMRKEVEKGASFEQARESVGVWRDVGFEHRDVSEKNFTVRALGGETVDDSVERFSGGRS